MTIYQKYSYLKVFTINHIPIYLHWSASVVLAVLALLAIPSTGISIILGVSYLGLLLLHELGHAYFAWSRGHKPLYINLSAIHGACAYETSYNSTLLYDEIVIAWGGILAQLIVFAPVSLYLFWFGLSPYPVINIPLLIFGGYSGLVILLNLLPITGLDGKKAWKIITYLFNKKTNNYSSPLSQRKVKKLKRNHLKIIK